MNRFNKTRRRVMRALCLLLFVICIAITTALGVGVVNSKAGGDWDFTWVDSGSYYNVVYHNKTKVMYVVSDVRYNIGTFTVLIDAEGKPLIWEG